MKKWTTLAFLCLAFFFYMADRQLFGLLVLPIQEETGLTNIQIGLIDTVMFWVLAVFAAGAGVVGDRFSRPRIITVAILLWGLFTALTGLAGGLIGFLIFRSFATTAAQTFYGPSATALIAGEHKDTRSVALSCHQGSMYVGMLTSGIIVAFILSKFGSWRIAYYVFGIATFIIGVIVASVFWRRRGETSVGAKKDLFEGMKAFFGNGAALCAGAGFIALNFVANAYAAWVPKFIAGKFELSVGETAKGVMLYPNIAAMLSVVSAGLISDWFVRRNPKARLRIQISALIVGAPMFVIFGFTSSIVMMWVTLIVWGICRGFFQANSHASVFDVIAPEHRSSAVGFLNFITCIIGSFAPLLVGAMGQHWGQRGFEIGFALMAVILLVSVGLMAYSHFFLFEKYRVDK